PGRAELHRFAPDGASGSFEPMKPEEIQALRRQLRCTPRELAEALGVPLEVVMAWEDEQQFPTKRYIERMQQLRERGPDAIVRRRGRGRAGDPPLKLLAEPELWAIFRKLIAYPEL